MPAAVSPARVQARPLRIVSSFRTLPETAGGYALLLDHVPIQAGWRQILKAHLRSLRRDVVILHCPGGKEMILLCLLRWLLPARARLIGTDVILTKPGAGWREWVKNRIKRFLFRQFDLLLLHQKDFHALEEAYGIPADKCRYLPFKVNSWATIAQLDPPEGDYIFTGGRSRRDYDTFNAAMRDLPYPTLLVTPPAEVNAGHGTVFREQGLPAQVKVVHDDGTPQSFINYLAGARLVVLPVRTDSISPSGVGVYLMAMALRKCVIITDSSATHDILEHEGNAILVPPADAAALRAAIRRAWEDTDYRQGIAKRARIYSRSLGGDEELRTNIAEMTVQFMTARSVR